MEPSDIADRLLHIERTLTAIDHALSDCIGQLLTLLEAREMQRQADLRAVEALMAQLRTLALAVRDVGR